jgi:hypothetical protein
MRATAYLTHQETNRKQFADYFTERNTVMPVQSFANKALDTHVIDRKTNDLERIFLQFFGPTITKTQLSPHPFIDCALKKSIFESSVDGAGSTLRA